MIHMFDSDLAQRFGILEAVLMQNIFYWTAKNQANGQHFHNGRYWTYNSAKAFAELFPYASNRQIERALRHLRDDGVLLAENLNETKYDRTLWYALTDDGMCAISHTGEIDLRKNVNGFTQEREPIPDNKPDINNPPISPQGEDAAASEKKTDDGFDSFWSAYPRKVAKEQTRKTWARMKKADRVAAMAALKRMKQSPQWTKDGGQFIPHPRTYLNQRRWEEAIPDGAPMTPAGKAPVKLTIPRRLIE